MCEVIDFNSYKESKKINSNNFNCSSINSTSENNHITSNIKIDQQSDFIDNQKQIRKYAPDPIKKVEDLEKIRDYFLSKKQYRNLLLFVMGINFGLRCGDLLKLKFGNIINKDGSFKKEVVLIEDKNKHLRTCYINAPIMNAMELYLNYLSSTGYTINLNDYLFTSLSNNNSNNYYNKLHCKSNSSTGKLLQVKRNTKSCIQVKSVEKMLKHVINDELGINVHAGTHLMRKTFAYQVIINAPDRNRAIEFLQKILGHKSPATTLYYAGITNDEIHGVCKNLYKGIFDFPQALYTRADDNAM